MTGQFLVCMGLEIAMQILVLGFSLIQIKIYRTQRMGLDNSLLQKYKAILICQLEV